MLNRIGGSPNLYITADQVGIQTGGGAVTFHESEAFKSFGYANVYGYHQLLDFKALKMGSEGLPSDPWCWDDIMIYMMNRWESLPNLTHFYAGTFTDAVKILKASPHRKVTYTAAAHSIEDSRKAHEELGVPFNYPHLTDPKLWEKYVGGYLQADRLIVPSTHSRDAMISFGADPSRIRIIPHGCVLPETVAPKPKRFTVGYLGAIGPDKGLKYLLQAWKKLNYSDANLMLGGYHSTSDYATYLIQSFGGGNIIRRGWVEEVSTFYNDISLYVQPSVTEGFGMEVLEAMAHGRAVLCSLGAGAVDLVPLSYRFKVGDVDELAEKIKAVKAGTASVVDWQEFAAPYSWDLIRQRYIDVWREVCR